VVRYAEHLHVDPSVIQQGERRPWSAGMIEELRLGAECDLNLDGRRARSAGKA